MPLSSGDMKESFKPVKKKKHMCRMQVTYEMIPQLLNIPNADELRFIDMYVDPARQIVGFIFEGDGLASNRGLRLFEVGEGQEIPNQILTEESIIEVMRRKVLDWDISQIRKALKKAGEMSVLKFQNKAGKVIMEMDDEGNLKVMESERVKMLGEKEEDKGEKDEPTNE
jgi:hypothetical protein